MSNFYYYFSCALYLLAIFAMKFLWIAVVAIVSYILYRIALYYAKKMDVPRDMLTQQTNFFRSMLSLFAGTLTLVGMCFSIKFGGHKYLTNILQIMTIIFWAITAISYSKFKEYSKNVQRHAWMRKQRK